MVWDRIAFKEKGKKAFEKNYWPCVGVAFLLMLIAGEIFGVSINITNGEVEIAYKILFYEWKVPVVGVTTFLFVTAMGVSVISLLLNVFVFNPLEIGGCRFYTFNQKQKEVVETILYPFQSGYWGNGVSVLFFRDLYTILWSLLFVIPGIVKAYEYRMIPYLIAEHPDMRKEDAFAKSKEMMDGVKLEAFILDLSFFGWRALSFFTLGLLNIFYVNPYVYATNAQVYTALKGDEAGKNEEETVEGEKGTIEIQEIE